MKEQFPNQLAEALAVLTARLRNEAHLDTDQPCILLLQGHGEPGTVVGLAVEVNKEGAVKQGEVTVTRHRETPEEICAREGHKLVGDDTASTESGSMGCHCERCGQSWSQTLY